MITLTHKPNFFQESQEFLRSLDMRALIVDDAISNQLIGKAIFKKLGVMSLVADSGSDALIAWASCHFDFVLIDFHMPGMSGAETIKELRGLELRDGRPSAFIIGGSTACSAKIRDEFLQSGANCVAEKPFSLHMLERLIQVEISSRSSGPNF